MRNAIIAMIVVAGLVATAFARTPPRHTKRDAWNAAMQAAWPDLQACGQRGVTNKVFGDVVVKLDPKTNRWTTSGSRSLGGFRGALEACVRDALKKRVSSPIAGDDDALFGDTFQHTQRIGTPVAVLPAAATLLPVWRRVMAGGKDASVARAELVRLAPPDYTVTKQNCFETTREYAQHAEYLWLPTVGSWVPRIWDKLMAKTIGYSVAIAIWNPAGAFVVRGPRGLCLVPFEATRQVAMRRDFDTYGACWAGGFADVLAQPRFAFPTDKKYTAVSTYEGRACAITTANEVVCCGAIEPALPAAPKPLTTISVGHGFACGLDKARSVACWGTSSTPPAGPFTKVIAGYQHACGLRSTGELACWSTTVQAAITPVPPKGKFVDISSACGVRTNGSVECWDGATRTPAGTYDSIATGMSHSCALRKDKQVGCWSSVDSPIAIPTPERFKDVVAGGGGSYDLCGRRGDDTVACFASPGRAKLQPPPSGKLVQLSGDREQYCGVRHDGAIDCWGIPWPGTWLGAGNPPFAALTMNPTVPPTMKLSGRIVDEWGKPLAGAEVVVCSEYGPCTSIAHDAMTSPAKAADLIAKYPKPSWAADTFAVATADRDGRWQGTVAVRMKTWNDQMHLVAIAPGREIVERSAHPLEASTVFAHDIAARPAIAVDLEPMCGGVRCAGKLSLSTSAGRRHEGTHLERLAPGLYTIVVRSNPGSGERAGKAIVDAPFGAKPKRVKIVMAPTGTGKSIRGTVELTRNGAKVDKVHISARCEGSGEVVYRSATSDATGKFEIADAGAPPCTVDLGPAGPDERMSGITSAKVDKLPATVTLKAAAHGY
jgi:hypothetical protein